MNGKSISVYATVLTMLHTISLCVDGSHGNMYFKGLTNFKVIFEKPQLGYKINL